MRDYNILMIKAYTKYFLVVDEISCMEVPNIKKKISVYLLKILLVKDKYFISDFNVIGNNAKFIGVKRNDRLSTFRCFISGTIIQKYSLRRNTLD